MAKTIAFLSDFGLQDPYVGVVKGVLLSINPSCQIIDITHEIPPQEINAAAFVLKNSYKYFPAGTVFLCVVDPGVGSSRRAIAVQTDNYFFVGPDNGLFWETVKDIKSARYFHLTNNEYFLEHASNTFHARDVFAPVAAYLSNGMPPDKMGESIPKIERSQIPAPSLDQKSAALDGEVIYIDHFGNLITNIAACDLKDPHSQYQVLVDRKEISISKCYDDAEEGALLAVIGGTGYLEISIKNWSAKEFLGSKIGDRVQLFSAAGKAV